ncbi:MAG TPA: hemerythrin domain-containing protein [Gaiellaceae bacterium]|jgi:iron-sulfur cluster repair protein YtfE (RIC family)|nr:hemerythrin domain-containing protein [Gaiellaceae bacterium]
MSAEQFQAAHELFLVWTDHLRSAARRLPKLEPAQREELVAEIVAFLREEVEPHMRVDEQVLYPTTAGRLGTQLVTAAIAYDHRAIRRWIARLAEAGPEDVATLQELLYGLDALIRVHLWKEDELLVHPLGSATWPASGA